MTTGVTDRGAFVPVDAEGVVYWQRVDYERSHVEYDMAIRTNKSWKELERLGWRILPCGLGGPSKSPANVDEDWWVAWLDARFGHADYLRLNRKFKEIHFHDCAGEIALALEIASTEGQRNEES